ncbi:hypothetical protein TRVL_09800 [Trypanosoma vivax]|nr:hypothetical protein TRVL_09800 [Trypanosoma vivax]
MQKTATTDIALGTPCGQKVKKQHLVADKDAGNGALRGMRCRSLLAAVPSVLISSASERHAEAMDLVSIRERTVAIQRGIYAGKATILSRAKALRDLHTEHFAKQLTLIMRAI